MTGVPEQLAAHLARELGAWPPPAALTLAGSPVRGEPGWDGTVRPIAGVRTPDGTVIAGLTEVVFRWTTEPADLEPLGEWRPPDDPALPDWLRPFGRVLAAFDDGRYVAGVGLKLHDEHVWEIAVGTDQAARGRGLARRVVATAARAVLDAGRVPTYLHDVTNQASARVAEAAGFPDRGWRYLVPAGPDEGAGR